MYRSCRFEQRKKFVCKFCNKRYSSGKALGGHIRTHMNENSAEKEAEGNGKGMKFPSMDGGSKNKRDSGSETGGWNSSYGLREKPKRTRWFVDSSSSSLHERFCKECGKGFQSLKALCGHMACHSEKEKMNENQKPEIDSQSVIGTSASGKLRRSNRTRYKTLDDYPLANGSSSVSEIEQEQEEAAMCLMMFSRDSGCRAGFSSVVEYSNNNSVVLEAKSSSIEVKITMKNGGNYASDMNQSVKLKKQRDELKTSEISFSDNSDSGYFKNGPKKAESDVSVDGSLTSGELKKPKVEYRSGAGGFNAELAKTSNRFNCVTSEFGGLLRNEGCDQVGRAFVVGNSRMRTKNGSYAQKRKKYECENCDMFFHSRRALGAHRASHTQINGCWESMYDRGENNTDTDHSLPLPKHCSKTLESCGVKISNNQSISGHSGKPKKSKGHECPICFRVFRSGQALGGHKRSHFYGGSEEKTIIIEQELPEFPGLIDLNLPAPIEEEADGQAEFMPWDNFFMGLRSACIRQNQEALEENQLS
ncbi:hypothetical protein F2P56_035960 [Juglans regia]|uniref:C2H2-type domain-containing protein n=3 Tax=Juglans regia TaxID=51240 RepID=A0A833TN31_JUGRE|nr:zinc finger protein 37-like isoform X1 [Juglans regia]KAF5443404.1 hypothetical protein F2P56_035960 [Juglans regia]